MAAEIDGRRVKERRKSLRLTQTALGRIVGIAQSQVSAWEKTWPGSGTKKPVGMPRPLRALAAALQTNEGYLLGETDDPTPTDGSRTPNADLSVPTRTVANVALNVLLPLWEISQEGAGPGGELLLRTDDRVSATDDFSKSKKAFCLTVWDDSNAPYVPRDATLYVNPGKKGKRGDWCLFFRRSDLAGGSIIAPAFGVLMGQRDNAWIVRQGVEDAMLSMALWPYSYLIELIKP